MFSTVEKDVSNTGSVTSITATLLQSSFQALRFFIIITELPQCVLKDRCCFCRQPCFQRPDEMWKITDARVIADDHSENIHTHTHHKNYTHKHAIY